MTLKGLHHSYFTNLSLLQLLASILTPTTNALSVNVYYTSFSGVTWDNANWVLENTVPDKGHYQSRGNLANGYIGINLASIGPFFEVDETVADDNVNGWPLFDRRQSFSTVAGFFDVQPTTNGTNYEWLNQLGGESVISGLPHWSGLSVEANGNILDASTDLSEISNFKSHLDLKNGYMSWEYTWTPPDSCVLNVSYALLVHKLHVNQAAVQLNISASEDTSIQVTDVFQGDCAVRTTPVDKQFVQDNGTIWSAVHPENIPSVSAYVYSTLASEGLSPASYVQVDDLKYIGTNSSGIAQQAVLNLKAYEAARIDKFVGIASSDAFDDPQTVAAEASKQARDSGFVDLFDTHSTEWQNTLTRDSIDDFTDPSTGELSGDSNIVEEQILAVVNPFFLLSNLISPTAVEAAGGNPHLAVNSIPVSGLSSSSYAGLIFWDVEVWMSPGLTVAFPQYVQQISNYRLEKYPQAQRNLQENFISSQNDTTFSPQGAIFPWTSGRYGNCTGTGPCFDYEYHINGDIALQFENYYIASGDESWFRDQFYPIYVSIAQTESDLLYLNETTNKYYLANATDPDEYANMITNPAFTMVLMQRNLNNTNLYAKQFDLPENRTWQEKADNVEIPIDEGADIISEYEGMNGSIEVKQADVVLIDDLLHWQNP